MLERCCKKFKTVLSVERIFFASPVIIAIVSLDLIKSPSENFVSKCIPLSSCFMNCFINSIPHRINFSRATILTLIFSFSNSFDVLSL